MHNITIVIRAAFASDITRAQLDAIAMAAAVQVEDPEHGPSPTYIETYASSGVGPFTVQRFRANSDGNGNPRRVFVFRDGKGEIVQTTDEEYSGREPVRAFERDHDCKVVDLGDVTCTPTEYKELLRNHP